MRQAAYQEMIKAIDGCLTSIDNSKRSAIQRVFSEAGVISRGAGMTVNILQALRSFQSFRFFRFFRSKEAVFCAAVAFGGLIAPPVSAQQSPGLESIRTEAPASSQWMIAGGSTQNSNTGMDQPEHELELKPPASETATSTPTPASHAATPPLTSTSSPTSPSTPVSTSTSPPRHVSDASITKKAAGVIVGATVGMPVAVVRRTAIEDRDGIKGLVGDSDNKLAKGLAGTFWMPFSIVLGVLEGPLYGPGNSVRNVNRPFTKEQMGMGDHLTSLLENTAAQAAPDATPEPIPTSVPSR